MENMNGDRNVLSFSSILFFFRWWNCHNRSCSTSWHGLCMTCFPMHFTDVIVSSLQTVSSAGWPLEPFRIFERSSFSPSRTVVVERKPASVYCLFFFATAFFLKPVSSVTPPIWLNGVDWTTTCQQYIFCWTFLLLLMTLAIVPFHRPPTLFLSFLCFSSIPHHHHISGIHKIIQKLLWSQHERRRKSPQSIQENAIQTFFSAVAARVTSKAAHMQCFLLLFGVTL